MEWHFLPSQSLLSPIFIISEQIRPVSRKVPHFENLLHPHLPKMCPSLQTFPISEWTEWITKIYFVHLALLRGFWWVENLDPFSFSSFGKLIHLYTKTLWKMIGKRSLRRTKDVSRCYLGVPESDNFEGRMEQLQRVKKLLRDKREWPKRDWKRMFLSISARIVMTKVLTTPLKIVLGKEKNT